MILNYIKLLWKNKYVRVALLTVALVVGGKIAYNHITNSYYKEGYATAQAEFDRNQEEVKSQYEAKLKDNDIKLTQLNGELLSLKSLYTEKLKNNEINFELNRQDVLSYEKNSPHTNDVIDTEWLRIYQESLPK